MINFNEPIRYNRVNILDVDSDTVGVYKLYNSSGTIIYIGEGKLRDRLKYHGKTQKRIAYFSYHVAKSKKHAQAAEKTVMKAYKAKYGVLPKHNIHLGGVK